MPTKLNYAYNFKVFIYILCFHEYTLSQMRLDLIGGCVFNLACLWSAVGSLQDG